MTMLPTKVENLYCNENSDNETLKDNETLSTNRISFRDILIKRLKMPKVRQGS